LQQHAYIVHRSNAAPHRKGDIDMVGNAVDQFAQGLTLFNGRRDIEKHEFVGSLLRIQGTQFYRVARIAQLSKLMPFTVRPSLISRQGIILLVSIVGYFLR